MIYDCASGATSETVEGGSCMFCIYASKGDRHQTGAEDFDQCAHCICPEECKQISKGTADKF